MAMTVRFAKAHWLHEPLLHFLLIGAGLFLLYHFTAGNATRAPRDIVVSEARVESLAENFAKTWLRPPTPAELKGLINDFVAEEVYYREAVAMGLDRDDTVIRRRLRQKMEFISEDVAAAVPPTDAQLEQYLDEHAAQFARPPKLTFQQVFFSSERTGATARQAAARLLAAIDAGRGPANPIEAGDPTLLPAAMKAATPQDITNTFGRSFADAIAKAPASRWAGPIPSSYGMHLVKIDDRVAGSAATLADVRPLVQREWEAEQRHKVNDALLATLRAKYQVKVEGPASALFGSAGPPTPQQATP
jgi:hypothetical protein